MPTPPTLDALEIADRRTGASAAARRLYASRVFATADGSVGTKNILGDLARRCNAYRARWNSRSRRSAPSFCQSIPNVDDVMALTHAYGCGVAINAPDAVVPIRTLQNLALNPNFGGEMMVVGLGCEKLAPERLVPEGVSDEHRAHAGRGASRALAPSSTPS